MPTPENLATDATVAIMLADGFEEVEALAVADVLYRAGVRADLISVTDARHVTSSHGIRVVADLMLEDVDLSAYTLLFLPGGMPGTLGLKGTPAIQAEVLRRADAGQPVAAICAAPSILAELGVLEGRHATANPAFVKAIAAGGAIVHENPVVVDEFIITSRRPGARPRDRALPPRRRGRRRGCPRRRARPLTHTRLVPHPSRKVTTPA